MVCLRAKRVHVLILVAHDLAGKGTWYRIRYCSDSRFNQYWKNFPGEGTEILHLDDGVATCFYKQPSGKEITDKFDRAFLDNFLREG